MSEHKSIQDQALEAIVYLPVGMYLAAKDEVPKLQAKGKAYVTTQVTMAKTVGNFAVTFGGQEAEKRLLSAVRKLGARWGEGPLGNPTKRRAQQGDLVAESQQSPNSDGGVPGEVPPRDVASHSNGSGNSALVNGNGAYVPTGGNGSTSLAIPGYDSLSASQVVQRLAGLSTGELFAVKAYEEATRGRRTIINRASQLLAPQAD